MSIVVGIAGPSNSGKSTLAQSLSSQPGCSWIEVDHYLKDKEHIPMMGRWRNWELSSNTRWEAVIKDIESLRDGKSIQHPIYSFSKGRIKGYREITPTNILIVEGYYLLTEQRVRELFDLSIYLELSDEELLKRRPCNEKGHDWDKSAYIKELVIPLYATHGRTQKAYADIVLDATTPPSKLQQQVMKRIKSLSNGSVAVPLLLG